MSCKNVFKMRKISTLESLMTRDRDAFTELIKNDILSLKNILNFT